MSTETTGAGAGAEITIYPDGPMLLRGAFTMVSADGSPIERRRRVIALCRCGHSAINPLCDGTHKLLRRRSQSRSVDDADDGLAAESKPV